MSKPRPNSDGRNIPLLSKRQDNPATAHPCEKGLGITYYEVLPFVGSLNH